MMTEVMFRIDKNTSEIVAVFPYDIVTLEGCIRGYTSRERHFACDYAGWTLQETIPATQEQYDGLMTELVNMGYDDLKVVTRRNHQRYLDNLKAARRVV